MSKGVVTAVQCGAGDEKADNTRGDIMQRYADTVGATMASEVVARLGELNDLHERRTAGLLDAMKREIITGALKY